MDEPNIGRAVWHANNIKLNAELAKKSAANSQVDEALVCMADSIIFLHAQHEADTAKLAAVREQLSRLKHDIWSQNQSRQGFKPCANGKTNSTPSSPSSTR